MEKTRKQVTVNRREVRRMLTTKERQQEAKKVLAIYMILPEKEKTMLLAYSTALRDRALLDEQVKQQVDYESESVGK